MSNKNIINKIISGILVNTMILGISNQVFENFKIFASSGDQEERILGESEKRIQGDEDYYNAKELYENNIDGNGLKYFLDGEEATVVSVDSEMKVITIPSHIKKDGKVYKVTRIGRYGFSNLLCGCSGLTSVTIPDSVREIGYCAFASCRCLTSVTIPDSVREIGYCAFASCRCLTGELTIPGSVKEIGAYAFSYCSSLTSVEICDGVTKICKGAFTGCSGLTSVKIGNGVTKIGYDAFSYCSSLTSIKIPGSVTKISDCAFEGCSSLTEVIVPDAKAIIQDAFPSGVEIKIMKELNENDIDNIGVKYELDGEEATVVSCVDREMKVGTIPSHIKKKGKGHIKKKGKGHIKKNGRGHIKKDGKVYKVTRIGASAFSDCSGLTKIIVPKGVEIDTCAFPSGVEIEEYKMQ